MVKSVFSIWVSVWVRVRLKLLWCSRVRDLFEKDENVVSFFKKLVISSNFSNLLGCWLNYFSVMLIRKLLMRLISSVLSGKLV